jgi:hypothetical protein
MAYQAFYWLEWPIWQLIGENGLRTWMLIVGQVPEGVPDWDGVGGAGGEAAHVRRGHGSQLLHPPSGLPRQGTSGHTIWKILYSMNPRCYCVKCWLVTLYCGPYVHMLPHQHTYGHLAKAFFIIELFMEPQNNFLSCRFRRITPKTGSRSKKTRRVQCQDKKTR